MEIKRKKISSYIDENNLNIEAVVQDFSNYVYSIIRNLCGGISNEDAEEIAVDVFLALWKNRDRLDLSKEMSPYISGITNNLIKKKYRELNTKTIDMYEENLVSSINIETTIIENEKMRVIANELKKLKTIDQNIFIKYYYEQMSIKEIARYFKISQSKVKVKLFRTRNKMKKMLEEGGYNFYE